MESTHKYTTRYDDKNKEHVLLKDEIPAYCHKAAPLVSQTQFGLNVTRIGCTTACNRANICKDGDKTMYVQTCNDNGIERLFELSKSEQKADTPLFQIAKPN